MFNGFKSPSTSPCPSPIRDLAFTIQRVRSPRKEKYKTIVESKEPIYSRGRMTMNGGFTDFRPCMFQKFDSLDSNDGTPSLSSSSRSASYDSGDAIMDPHNTKPIRRFVKVPKRVFITVIEHLSPQLAKKLLQAEKNHPIVPKDPVWPNVMTTYGRAISLSPVQNMVEPPVPSLTAMKTQAILDEKREVRSALQLLAEKISQRRPKKTSRDSSYSSEEDLDEPPRYEDLQSVDNIPSQNIVLGEDVCKDLMRFNITSNDAFPINTDITVQTPDDPPGGEVFQDESTFEALDLDSVPTITPEELVEAAVNEVRNIHVVCDYIVLETGPSSESVFV